MDLLDGHIIGIISSLLGGPYFTIGWRATCRRLRRLIPPPPRAPGWKLMATAAFEAGPWAEALCRLARACGSLDYDQMMIAAISGNGPNAPRLVALAREWGANPMRYIPLFPRFAGRQSVAMCEYVSRLSTTTAARELLRSIVNMTEPITNQYQIDIIDWCISHISPPNAIEGIDAEQGVGAIVAAVAFAGGPLALGYIQKIAKRTHVPFGLIAEEAALVGHAYAPAICEWAMDMRGGDLPNALLARAATGGGLTAIALCAAARARGATDFRAMLRCAAGGHGPNSVALCHLARAWGATSFIEMLQCAEESDGIRAREIAELAMDWLDEL